MQAKQLQLDYLEALYLFISYDQPWDAWDALRNHFEHESLATRSTLELKLKFNERYEGNY